MNINIAMLQLLPGKSTAENQKKGMEACRRAKEMGADIALFPEMWSDGYQIPEDRKLLQSLAVPSDGEFVNSFSGLAAQLDMAIAITFLEQHDPLPRNTMCLFDRFGHKVLSYSKVHTCDFGDEKRLSAGDDFYVTTLHTAKGDVETGAMICFDREFPESARILMLKGAELILVPNACPMEINRISQLRGRAYENMLSIVTVNYPDGHPDCNGHSTAFDGIAYTPDSDGSRDTLILDAGENEGIYLVEIPIDAIRAYRSHEVHGNAYRHPQKYAILTETDIREPFIRKDYRV